MTHSIIRLELEDIPSVLPSLVSDVLQFKDLLWHIQEGLPVTMWADDASIPRNILVVAPSDDEQENTSYADLYAPDPVWIESAMQRALECTCVTEWMVHGDEAPDPVWFHPDLFWRTELDLQWHSRPQRVLQNDRVFMRHLSADDHQEVCEFLFVCPDIPDHLRQDTLVALRQEKTLVWGLWHQRSLAAFLTAKAFVFDLWDVEFIYTAERFRGSGFASLLATNYGSEISSAGMRPLYCSPLSQASQRAAENAGFRVYKRRLHGMTRDNWHRLPYFAD